jgi:hypothetical protein
MFDSVPNDLLFGLFQAALGSAVTLGGLIELAERRWNWSAFSHQMARSELPGADERERVLEIANRASMIGRVLLGAPLAVGIGGAVLAWSTVLLLALALRLSYKHNLMYITACIAVIASTGTQGLLAPDRSPVPVWAPAAVTVLLFGLYMNGAWWKWKSVQFRSGATLYVILISSRIGNLVGIHHSESIPESIRKWCHRAALLVIASEAALPVLLLIPPITPFAVAAGALLHVMFLAVQPSRLLPFQMAALGSYTCVGIIR